jgi:hypothetical protein
MAKKHRIPHKFLPWIEARKKYKLSHMHIQMARELGLSPKKFGSYANRDQQPWKLPLVEFIEFLYERQFKKKEPDEVKSIEQIAGEHVSKRNEKKAAKAKVENESSAPESAVEPESRGEVSLGLIAEKQHEGPDSKGHDQASEAGDGGDDRSGASIGQIAASDQGIPTQTQDTASDQPQKHPDHDTN